jgi:hypothetical protein
MWITKGPVQSAVMPNNLRNRVENAGSFASSDFIFSGNAKQGMPSIMRASPNPQRKYAIYVETGHK